MGDTRPVGQFNGMSVCSREGANAGLGGGGAVAAMASGSCQVAPRCPVVG